jgi:glycosyltransferase involved in cell wall biosynthesis
MKVVMISQMVPYLPCHDGFRLIPANLLKHLAARHEYHLLAFSDGRENAEQLNWARQYCASVTTILDSPAKGFVSRAARILEPLSISQAIHTHLQALRPDLIHLEGPHTASLVKHAPPGCATMLSAHDCLFLRFSQFAGFANSTREKLRFRLLAAAGARFERKWFGRVGHVVVTSPLDAGQIKRLAPSAKVSVVPNGVDCEDICQARRVSGRIVFTGNMSYFPNEDAADYFVRQAFPLVRQQFPAAEFWIVGSSPSARVQELGRFPGVKVTGAVPRLFDYIQTADVYVSPLRFGAGIKNKILEAMTAETPIVATSVSLPGTPLVSGRHLLEANSPSEMAAAVLRILNDTALAHALAREAKRELEERYTWDRISQQIDAIYSTLVSSTKSSPSGAPRSPAFR